tara:strand:- start:1976 stop:2158 length:183 start_codon:yes stop_codon:yes gene_type:complete
MFIQYKKGDLVKIDAYLAGYANGGYIHGIIISQDPLDLVSVLVNGQVDIVLAHHLEKVIK